MVLPKARLAAGIIPAVVLTFIGFLFLYTNLQDCSEAGITTTTCEPCTTTTCSPCTCSLNKQMKQIEELASERSEYWRKRKSAKLYTQEMELAQLHAPNALTALDVGSYESPFLSRLHWIPTKVATDIQSRPDVWQDIRGIAFVQGDFMQLKFATIFDLVLCTQVVEHLKDPGPFVGKMASIARVLIVSTTYEMPAGTIEGHVQDPISEQTFRSWFDTASKYGRLSDVLKIPGEAALIDPADGVRKPVTNIVGIWKRNVTMSIEATA